MAKPSRIDKKLEQIGYAQRYERRKDVSTAGKMPIIFLEYYLKDSVTFWSDTDKASTAISRLVSLYCIDFETGEFGIKAEYEQEEDAFDDESYDVYDNKLTISALGGGRSYGYILRTLPASDLDLFVKKAKELKRAYMWKHRLARIFGRGV